MKRTSENFIHSNVEKLEDLGGGIKREFLGHDNQIMMVKVYFEKGAIGSPHQHFHTQATYCAKGKFEFTIGGNKQIVSAGDGIYMEPNVLHDALCLEEGILIDVFSPVREDFLDGTKPSYLGK